MVCVGLPVAVSRDAPRCPVLVPAVVSKRDPSTRARGGACARPDWHALRWSAAPFRLPRIIGQITQLPSPGCSLPASGLRGPAAALGALNHLRNDLRLSCIVCEKRRMLL